jgi:deoxyribonuclease-4
MKIREGRENGMHLGAHMSIAGGIEKAVARGAEIGATALQIFTRNQVQWQAKPLTDAECAAFREARSASAIGPVVGHASYLINIASPDDELWRRSIDALQIDYERSEALGLDALVFHPGAYVDADLETGLRRIAEAAGRILSLTPGYRCRLAFETTAGAGSQIGSRFEEIARLLAASGPPERLGVCIDTCHIFVAGYDVRDERRYRRVMREFDAIVGIQHLVALHVNDSKGDLGSRVDRHAHIGHGKIGLEGFRAVVRDHRLDAVPKILETPKGEARRPSWDEKNLATLRRLSLPSSRSGPGHVSRTRPSGTRRPAARDASRRPAED